MHELEPKWVDAFVEAARDTFSTMAMMDLDVESVVASSELQGSYDVLTTIGLSGEKEGLLGIGCDQKFASEFVSAMLGMEPDELSADDISDGAGELANMVAGGAKASLSTLGLRFDLALPVVLSGAAERIHLQASSGAWVRTRVGESEVSLFLWMKS